MNTRSTLLLLFLASLLMVEARAATRTVTNLNDSGSGSLRDTIAAAGDGDEIVFAANVRGTITLTSGQLTVNKQIVIAGPGANLLTIARSSASGTPPFRLFHTTAAASGGGIADLTLAGGLLTDTFGDGGCIYNAAESFTLRTCHIRDNRASKNGGAIYHDGAASGREARFTADGCTFSGNYAGESGGAIYSNGSNDGYAIAELINCTFYRNGAGVSAGAVYTVALRDGFAQTHFRSSTVVENNTGNANVTSIEVDAAVGYFSDSVSYTIAPVTFVERNGGRFGSFGYNLGQPKDHPFLASSQDRLVADYPLDPVGLQPNGGPAPTIAVVPGPAVDGGSSRLTTDARGRPRPYDFSSVPNRPPLGNGSDVGAYEADDPVQKGLTSSGEFILRVNSLDDHDDNTCGEADCTLREAIQRTNAARAAGIALNYTINFAAGLTGTIMLKRELNQLEVHGGVTIAGPGARRLAVSGGTNVRVFYFSAPGESVISGLTIRDGNVFPSGDRGASTEGGGILNAAKLTLNDCHLVNNDAAGDNNTAAGGHGGTGRGGAIHNTGNLALNRCTLADNSASGGAGGANPGFGGLRRGGNGGSGLGGAISNSGTLTLNNCTVAGGRGTGAAGGQGSEGGDGGTGVAGVYSIGNSVITATTISGNYATAGAGGSGDVRFGGAGKRGTAVGGFGVAGGTNRVRNTISAGNTGRDADGTFTSEGYNLIGVGDFSSGFNNTGDQVGTSAAPIDPKLGPLQNNLGLTDTMAIAFDSPAFDGGNSFGLTRDQRLISRPYDHAAAPNASGGDGSDIGAFESPEAPPASTPTPAPTEAPSPTPPTRLANISTRLRVETGENVLIGGFIVTGSTQKRIIVRALGPSLPLGERLENPVLELYNSSGELIASNDNWQDAPNRQEIIDSTVAPPNDLESAVLQDVELGPHTAVVSGAGGGTGVGLVEVYDVGAAQDSKLANISTRGRVLTGDDVMIGGLIVTGTNPQNVIVRALGPSLPLDGVLGDPLLELYDSNGNPMTSNDNWKDTQQGEIEGTGIPPSNDLDAAIVTSLPPAAYTAVVSGVNGSTGVGLVEVYALP